MVPTRGPRLAARLVDAVVDADADVTGDGRSAPLAARRGVSDGG